MPMLAIFGAEVVGAEILAAEAAAAAAAEAAAVEAARVAAVEAAAQEAARQTAQQAAAQTVANSGITGVPDPSQLVAKGSFNPSTGQFINTTLPPAAPPSPPPVNTMGLEMPGAYVPEPMYSGMGMESQIPANQFIEPGSGGINSVQNTIAQANVPVTPPSGLEAGFDKALKFAEKNPFTAMTLAYTGANALGLMNPSGATFNQEKYNGPLSKYKLSPNFQPGSANPADFQYRPRYATGGGIMGAPAYDIPVGYDEGGPVALPMPSRTMRDADVFQTPGAGYDPMQQGAADAYNDIIRNRVNTDTASGRLTDANLGYYQATPNQLTSMAQGRGAFTPGFARDELGARSAAGEFAVPGYGDLGQFAGGGGGGKANTDLDLRGGDMAFAKGGSLSDSIESYQKMLAGKPQAAPARSADVGIYYDQDPDTRYQDALTAAQIRQAKVNQRAYVSPPAAKRPTPMGQLQMASVKPRKQSDGGGGDVEAAQGGIMQSSLGGYAAGGNPRLLKGPGDGMSDNIPATINRRQPARLADGEFVIPADVVSHLGNGSTEAGAKQLHAMMDKVRKARTGNPKQGKQIKPQKYMPK